MILVLLLFDTSIHYICEKFVEKFANIFDWLVDNKLNILSGENRTISILFAFKRYIKIIPKLNILHHAVEVRQHYTCVTYLGFTLDETISGNSLQG